MERGRKQIRDGDMGSNESQLRSFVLSSILYTFCIQKTYRLRCAIIRDTGISVRGMMPSYPEKYGRSWNVMRGIKQLVKRD